MKSLTESPVIAGIIIFLMLCAFFINSAVLFYQFIQKRSMWGLIMRLIVFFAVFLVFECTLLVFRGERKDVAGIGFFLDQKAFLALADATLLFFISLLGIKNVRDHQKNHITPLSVKESIDSLPAGLCCYGEGGLTRLVNTRMESICNTLFGITLSNGEEFEWALKHGRGRHGAEFLQTGDNPVVRIKDGIIAFKFSDIVAGDVPLRMITAQDVSREYTMNAELEEENIALAAMNERLRAINSDIARVTEEKEILDMKLGIHDSFGQFLLAAKHYLNEIRKNYYDEESIIESRRELCEFWPGSDFYAEAEGTETKDGYDALFAAAEKVGVRITGEGEAWYDEEGAKLAQTAIHECLTNTIRHAGGDELYVRFYEDHGKILEITNNGKVPENAVVPRGGLMYLSEFSKESGMEMTITSKPQFKLTIKRSR